jgi:hypothetical protein
MSVGTPSRTLPSNLGVLINPQISSFSAIKRRGCKSSLSPSEVNVSCRCSRSKISFCSRSSSRLICWLTAPCVRFSKRLAAVIHPVSEVATKARARATSMFSKGRHIIEDKQARASQLYWRTFERGKCTHGDI